MSSAEDLPLARDRAAAWVLGWPLAALLGLMFVAQFVFWVPTYAVGPWWGDHDVFESMAHGWDTGLLLPYRDLIGNNFPGTIYLCWVLGKVFGWGNSAAFYMVDAALIAAFVAMLVVWSLRRFGRALPGLLGAGAVMSYFLSLDMTLTGQRDGQAPILATIGLLVLQTWPGRVARVASALLLALGLTIRPQVAVFVPAYWLAIDASVRPTGEGWKRSSGAIAIWTFLLIVFAAAGLAPLALAGVLGDFFQSLRAVSYGSSYNKVKGLMDILKRLVAQLSEERTRLIAPLAVLLGSRTLRPEDRRLAVAWGAALLGVALYFPLSPGDHFYLHIPLRVVLAVFVAILAQLLLSSPGLSPSWRLTFVALLMALVVTARPDRMGRTPTFAAIRALRSGRAVETAPLTFREPFDWIPDYPWKDYRNLLDYLRTRTSPETRVANLVPGLAVAGSVARLPAFPTESANWLVVVRPDDEPRFVEALDKTPDSVVVWDPAYTEMMAGEPNKLVLLNRAIPRLYEPSAKFGRFEVWTRKPDTPKGAPGK